MKKVKLISLMVILVLIFTGCEGLNPGTGQLNPYSLTVEVLDDNDNPVSGADVIAGGDTISSTDDSGTLELTGLKGEVEIGVNHPDYTYSTKTVTENDADTTLVFNPDPYASLDDVDGLAIKGYFGEADSVDQVNAMESADSTSIDKVVLIYKNDYKVVEVNEDGAFISELRGEPCGVAFADTDGNFAGHLVVEGLNSIPAHLIDEDIEEIDLGEIIIEDGEASTEYDMGEVNIPQADLETMAVAGSFFSAAAMSPDLIEAMVAEENPMQIKIGASYFPTKSNFLKPVENIVEVDPAENISVNNHRLLVTYIPILVDQQELDTTTFNLEYPDNRNISYDESQTSNFEGQLTSVDFLAEEGIPPAGTYAVTTDPADISSFNFQLPNIIDQAKDNLITPKPQVELYKDDNGEWMIDKISWVYETLNGELVEAPENILNYIEIQISVGDSGLIGDYEYTGHGDNRVYNSGNIEDISSTEKIIRDEIDIYWNDVSAVNMAYNDYFDVHYVITFNNQRE